MSHDYKRTFDQIEMPQEQAEALRSVLASRHPEQTKEEQTMKHRSFLRRPICALAALILILSLSVTAMAYGGRIVENVYNFFIGGAVEQGIDEYGDPYVSGSVDTDTQTAPIELREDGRMYLTVNGENLDITDEFSYTTPYIYECTGSDGLRHVFVIGGELDAAGWAEFIWNEAGLPTAGETFFGTPGGSDDAPWLNAAMKELELPWAF